MKDEFARQEERLKELGLSPYQISDVMPKYDSPTELRKMIDHWKGQSKVLKSDSPATYITKALVNKWGHDKVIDTGAKNSLPPARYCLPSLHWQQRFKEDTEQLNVKICPYFRRVWGLRYGALEVRCMAEVIDTGQVMWFFANGSPLMDHEVDRARLGGEFMQGDSCGDGCTCYGEEVK